MLRKVQEGKVRLRAPKSNPNPVHWLRVKLGLTKGEWRGGISPPRSLRTGREPLGSSGSQYPAVGLIVQQLCLGHVAPPVTGWPPALGGIPQPLRSNSITEPSSLLRTAPSLCPASVLLPSRGSPA